MGLRTVEEYRSSLRDGRKVYFRGALVDDVTTHPVTSIAVRHACIDYEMAEDPRFHDLAIAEEGYSRYFKIPKNSDDLLKRSVLIETVTRQGKTLSVAIKEVGSDALLTLNVITAKMGGEYRGRFDKFYQHCRDNDLALAVAQTDVKGDRSLGPSKQPNPDAYLRIVERRPDGIVVRGAKVHTTNTIYANELIVLPTREMSEADADYAVAFAIPLNTPGLRLIASPYHGYPDTHPFEHPLSTGHKLMETLTLFEDVFVPNERIFLQGEWPIAGELARTFVEYHRFTAISYKLPLVDALVGSAQLAAELNGIDRAGHAREKIAWLVAYAETLRALTHHAAEHCIIKEPEAAVPDPMISNIAKLHFATGIHTAMQHVQDLAGGLLVTAPAEEDLTHPEYGKAVRSYLRGATADGETRLRVMNMISELTTSDYGGYHTILAIHAEGSIEVEKLTILRRYDMQQARNYARWLAGVHE